MKTITKLTLDDHSELLIKVSPGEQEQKLILQVVEKASDSNSPDKVTPDGGEQLLQQSIELPINTLTNLKRCLSELEQTLNGHEIDFLEAEDEPGELDTSHRPTTFAHESEQEFAQILDFYQIEWLYEPCTFAIRWDKDGNVIESFTPDFYLPEQDQYIELTTLKQEHVTKKNRKVRLLRGLYPGINIKIIYGKDYRRLLEKYSINQEVRTDKSIDSVEVINEQSVAGIQEEFDFNKEN